MIHSLSFVTQLETFEGSYIALHVNQLKFSISTLMVELGLPVVAFVKNLVTCCRLGANGNLIGLVELEGRAASDDMNVRGDLAWEYNGITALNGERLAVDGELGRDTLQQGKTGKGLNKMGSSHCADTRREFEVDFEWFLKPLTSNLGHILVQRGYTIDIYICSSTALGVLTHEFSQLITIST